MSPGRWLKKPGLVITQAPFWDTGELEGRQLSPPGQDPAGRLAMPQTRRLPLAAAPGQQIGFFHRETRVAPVCSALEVAVCEEVETRAQPLRMRALWAAEGGRLPCGGLWEGLQPALRGAVCWKPAPRVAAVVASGQERWGSGVCGFLLRPEVVTIGPFFLPRLQFCGTQERKPHWPPEAGHLGVSPGGGRKNWASDEFRKSWGPGHRGVRERRLEKGRCPRAPWGHTPGQGASATRLPGIPLSAASAGPPRAGERNTRAL